MLRESAKKLGVTGREVAVLEQKDRWAVELRDVIVRIVKTANRRGLILFGSCARGQRSLESDVDLLVIIPGPVHRRDLAAMIYRNLHGVPVPVDVIVVTEDDILQFGSKPGTVLYPALKEGIVVYEAFTRRVRRPGSRVRSNLRRLSRGLTKSLPWRNTRSPWIWPLGSYNGLMA